MAALQMIRTLAARPHLTTVDSVRAVIENENPRPFDTFRLRLCLFSVEVFNNGQGIHADFVDADLAEVFADFNAEYKNLARAQRIRFIFRLTVWGPRNGPAIDLGGFHFKPGDVVEMNQVAGVSAWKNLCQGTSELAHLQLAQPTANN